MDDDDQNSRTRGQNAYRLVLDAIRAGLYRPGDRLREEEVAQRLGMSRTPVREALGRLQEKGLIEGAAGRGLAVAKLNMQQVLELYATRAEFEGSAARLAAQQISDIELDNLERISAAFAATVDNPAEAAHLNRVFHARIYDAARNRYLRQALDDLQDVIALLPETTFVEEGRTAIAAGEHAAILDALKHRDPSAAHGAAVEHIRSALRARLRLSG